MRRRDERPDSEVRQKMRGACFRCDHGSCPRAGFCGKRGSSGSAAGSRGSGVVEAGIGQLKAEKKALLAEFGDYNSRTASPVAEERAAYFVGWKKKLVARSSVYLAAVNQLTNDVAEALGR